MLTLSDYIKLLIFCTVGIIVGNIAFNGLSNLNEQLTGEKLGVEASGSELVISKYSSVSPKPVEAEGVESEAADIGAEADSTESEAESADSWELSDIFEDVAEGRVISALSSNEVSGVSYDSSYIYVETTTGEHLKTNFNNSIIEYARMKGIEVFEISAPSSSTLDSSASSEAVSSEASSGATPSEASSEASSGASSGVSNATTDGLQEALRTGLVLGVLILGISGTISILQSAYAKKHGSLCAGDELRRIGLNQTQKGNSSTQQLSSSKKRTADGEYIPDVRFSDVQGVDELKQDIFRIVDFLKNSEKYTIMGARTPKGIILYGPPGTGKTLLAKAIAGEAEVPFFHASGSDFVEMYVGMGAKRVRELYQKARKAAPSIVFIDEVDAIAHKRGQLNNSEDDKTINALLTELDGFKGETNVVTICATNRLDLLDSAFQRAGRFDLKLAVSLPDRKARYEILRIHSKNKHFQNPNAIEALAKKTPGFSGAELEGILNESAIIAASQDQDFITDQNIEDAFYKVLLKGNKKKNDLSKETMEKIAWHECGHVLATKLLTKDKVPSVTIIGSTSGAGGVTFRVPDETNLRTKQDLRNEIAIKFGGRAAEELLVSNKDLVTTGASQDITEATSIIKSYICKYGMGRSGLIDHTQFTSDISEAIEGEAIELSEEVYKEVLKLLNDNYNTLQTLASYLLENETLSEEEIDSIISTGKLPISVDLSKPVPCESSEPVETEDNHTPVIGKEVELNAYTSSIPIWLRENCKIYSSKEIDTLYHRLKLHEVQKAGKVR